MLPVQAINNNPFEYWITHDDAEYNRLMEKVQDFINNPGAGDVEVESVFTQTMFNNVRATMRLFAGVCLA